MFLQALYLLSAQNMCVLWKHANLPGWLHWPKAIDYTPSRLECHWDTGGDQILLRPNLSPPLLSAVWKMASNCCCTSQSRNGPVCVELGQNGIHFLFFSFFLSWYAESVFSSLVTMQLLEQEESCCWDTLCFPFFMFILWLSHQLVMSWALSSPTVPCRKALVWHSGPFIFFSILLSDRVSRGQRARGNENRGGKCFQPGFHLLISSVCSLLSPVRERK